MGLFFRRQEIRQAVQVDTALAQGFSMIGHIHHAGGVAALQGFQPIDDSGKDVIGVGNGVVVGVHQRLGAVRAFSAMAEAEALAAANKRVSNILRKSKDPVSDTVDPGLFQLEEERLLFQGLESLGAQVRPLLNERRYTEALAALAALRAPADAFFDKVMVMDPDPALRVNRLALLGIMQTLFLFIADLSLLKAGE